MEEFRNILSRDLWELVDRPKGRLITGCRPVLKNKLNPDGTLNRREVHLVARGFTQRPGIDFVETFAPVARLGSLRLMMAISIRYKVVIHQIDVVTAYSNGFLNEKVYMKRPEMLEEVLQEILLRKGKDREIGVKAARMLTSSRGRDAVYLLRRTLYGLRQAGRQWHA